MATVVQDYHKVPKLHDGRGGKFIVWNDQTKAFAFARNLVLRCVRPESWVEDERIPIADDDPLREQKIQVMDDNKEIVLMLQQAFTKPVHMGFIRKSTTMAHPNGQAHVVMQELFKKYALQDAQSKMDLKLSLQEMTMNSNSDPEDLFERIDSEVIKYADECNEEDIVASIVQAAPTKYDSAIMVEQRMSGGRLTESGIKEAMNGYYRRNGGGKKKNKNKTGEREKEVQLSNIDKKKTDNRECYSCHEKGHVAADCPNKKPGEIKCDICGGRHCTAMCWNDERTAHQRPEGWVCRMTDEQKEKAEKAAANVGTKGVFLLNAEFSPPDPKINKAEPSLWIGPYYQKKWKDDEEADNGSVNEYAESQEEKKDEYSVSEKSVNTMTAAELLMTCATGMDELDVTEEELDYARKECENKSDWKPPAECTRSKTKANERNDAKRQQVYEQAEKIPQVLEMM
jgi:hypothetical protein